MFKCSKRASPGNLEAVEDLLSFGLDGNDSSQGSSISSISGISCTSSSSISSAVSPVIAAVIVNGNEKGDLEVAISWCDLSSLRIGFSLGLL